MSGDPVFATNTTDATGVWRSSWECHRCGVVNAPHVNACSCSRASGVNPPFPFIGEPYAPLVPADPYVAPGPGPVWPGLLGGTFSCSVGPCT